MRERFQRFMIGRYGVDSFGKFLNTATLVLLILSLFFRRGPFYSLALLLLVYTYYRMFSKNHPQRYRENEAYLAWRSRITSFFRREKSMREQRKIYHIYKCPTCRQKIRIPRGKGKISITCPKCHAEFIKRS